MFLALVLSSPLLLYLTGSVSVEFSLAAVFLYFFFSQEIQRNQ